MPRTTLKFSILSYAVIIAVLCLFTMTTTVSAATLTVNKTADTADGVCDADCSLREAVGAAAASGDTIDFSALFNSPQTITLGGTQIGIAKNLIIIGPGDSFLTVSGNSLSRVFSISAGFTVSISGLTVTGGSNAGNGGGIYSAGTLFITGSRISGNYAAQSGGGIINDGGSLTVSGSDVIGNTAGIYGGGIGNGGSGTVTLTACSVSNNTALLDPSQGGGGGIMNFGGGTFNIGGCAVNGNTSARVGGGIRNSANAALTLTNSVVDNNTTTAEFGGGIFNGGSLTINGGTVNGNSAPNGFGGGLYNNGAAAVMNINKITINGNTAGNGAGIGNFRGALNVINSTVSNNQSQFQAGGLDNQNGTATFVNSTVSGNVSGSGYGGGLLNFAFGTGTASVALTNSTVAYNTGGANGGGFYTGNFGVNTTTRLKNTLVANNTGVNFFTTGTNGFLISDGNNLDSEGTSGFVNGVNGDKVGSTGSPINAYLLPLANNGGAIQTHALQLASPAIDAGNNAAAVDKDNNALTFDQRGTGFPRIFNTTVDIGAFESQVVDTTPPVITPNVSGTLGNNGWYVSNVSVSWTVTEAESIVTSQTGCGMQTVSADTAGVTFTCSATSAGGTDSNSVTIKRDTTNPSISFVSRTPAANANGWNNTNVAVNWSCSDATSGAASASVNQTVSAEGANQSATGTCADNAGNTASDTQTGINVDKTAPTLAPTVSPNPVLLGGAATATPNASDALSGIASQSCGAVNTATVGNKSVACTATDLAGNTANANANYSVIFNFAGFFQPVDNLPIINLATAGSSIPVKFSLGGNQGLAIFAAGYPASVPIACANGTPTSGIEETTTAGASTLTYDAATNRYNYVWKTDRAWRGTCRQLQVKFIDGKTYVANFQFR